jgi:hypothetical protein
VIDVVKRATIGVRSRVDERRRAGAPMVHWLNPTALVTTGVDLLLSGVFSRYADKRGLVAAGPVEEPLVYSSTEDLWIDYVADAGDGWVPTYAVASAACTTQEAGDETTQPGRLLVFGGDQVYPSAEFGRYQEKLVQPYDLAAPQLPPGARNVLAIPGNHDWYDGLTAFMRIFAEGTPMSVWQTQQRRSYFLARLSPDGHPHRWWLVGIDIGFGTYLDAAQLQYFRRRRGDGENDIQAGDRVILCTGKPTWSSRTIVGDYRIHKHSHSTLLEEFEREIVHDWGCKLPLVISGDLHHYARYEVNGGERQRVTAGGGGAYLFPTHGLPSHTTDWPDPATDGTEDGIRKEVYPGAPCSRGYRKQILTGPLRNGSFLALIGVLHAVIASQVMGGIHAPDPADPAVSLSTIESLYAASLTKFWSTIFTRPLAGLLAAVLFLGLFAFADGPGPRRLWWALCHWLGQITLVALSMLAAARVAELVIPLPPDPGRSGLWEALGMLLFFVVVLAVGALAGAALFGGYLWLAERRNLHANDAFSALAIMDHKSFVRMRLASNGALDLFAFGVSRIKDDRPKRRDVDQSFMTPPRPPEVRLIEQVSVWKPEEAEVEDGFS